MLRECDRETVEALSGQFLEIIRDFQMLQTGQNMELLNAIAIAGAVVLASADRKNADLLRDFFMLALDNQTADFREQFGDNEGPLTEARRWQEEH